MSQSTDISMFLIVGTHTSSFSVGTALFTAVCASLSVAADAFPSTAATADASLFGTGTSLSAGARAFPFNAHASQSVCTDASRFDVTGAS